MLAAGPRPEVQGLRVSYSTTSSWTRTDAREVASKVKADLGYMRIFHGKPSEEFATKLETELTEVLAAGYLSYVIYGFMRDSTWVVALRYEAQMNGTLADQGAGRLASLVGKDTSNATWHSYLVHNSAWWALSEAERERFEASLPIQRTTGTEPGTGSGYWESDRSYASGGGGVARSVLRSS
jgi:hypothetical protein